MNSKDIRIVFMGTPEFAVGSLKALVEGGYNVVGVVTMPDKPAGRGHKIQYSAVKQYALENGLKLMQPEKLKDEAFISELKALNADLQIVVAFRMLPEIVWSMPPMGTFNLHVALCYQIHSLGHQPGSDFHQTVIDCSDIILRRNRRFFLKDYVACVYLVLKHERSHACFLVAVYYRPVDRRSASVLRQQRAVKVEC
ncbi:MAG: hypothetical protein II129_04095, partial [Paludibacteraceae bacterium]|nr:hypothetical protein [Paludibacteraceae bacterium]